ncbi:MAG: hypothetical protein DI570_13485 [Phenylobacterium zucineum]|nr:MAG: hypothetical protein DI570_13485 [Phenylobacterium zucineum]
MDKQTRRDVSRDYKEKAPEVGVYAIDCAPTGETWVAGAKNLAGQENRHWFSLKTGGHTNRVLQAAWAAHGAAAFGFRVLERLDVEEMTPLGVADLIKARERHWLETLGARKLVG